MVKKNLTKFAVFLIAIIMVVCIFVGCENTESTGDVDNINDLSTQLGLGNNTVKLLSDINSPDVELFTRNLFTLDLNGKTLTVKGFKVTTENEGTLTITNGKIIAVNGDIEIIAPKATINLDKVTGNVSENAKITLNGSKNTVNLGEVNFIYIGKDVAVPLTIPADTRVVIASSVTKPITLNVVGGDVIIENNSNAVGNKITVAESVTSKVDIKNSGKLDTVENNSTQDEIISVDNTVAAIPPIVIGTGAEKVEQKKDGEKLITYTVTYETNGGSAISKYNVIKDSKITSKESKKQGYTFDGWYIDESFNDKAVFPLAVTENITLYAKWTINSYTIIFDTDGSNVETINKSYNETIATSPITTKEGYTFDGWYDGENKVSFPYTVTDNKTLTAKWITHNHSYVYSESVSPTCTADGYDKYLCDCGETEKREIVPLLGHFGGTATCTEKAICERCSLEYGVTAEHTFESNFTMDLEPTCTENGSKSKHCTNCDEKEEITVIDALGHIFNQGICIVCHLEQIEETQGLAFSEITGGYEVSGIGTVTDNIIIIPAKHNGQPVTSIGNNAFKSCNSLTSITIPESVISIGNEAFSWCSRLVSITIPNSLTSIGAAAFSWCSILTSITIPNCVTSIGDSAFHGCSSLTSITIPNSVNIIGSYAFLGCSSLESITVERGNSKYESKGNCLIEKASKTLIQGFNNSIIPTDGSVTSIGNRAFYGCSGLISKTIPNSVTSIGDEAFYECSSLISITIPNSVTSIGSHAFSNCSKLERITIPNSVTSIGNRAFIGCSSLISITIPNSVTSIGYEAFYGCSSLISITIPNSVTSIGSDAFNRCSSLVSIIIPSNVTSIGSYAFQGCNNLTIYAEAESKPSGWVNWNPENRPVIWNYKP